MKIHFEGYISLTNKHYIPVHLISPIRLSAFVKNIMEVEKLIDYYLLGVLSNIEIDNVPFYYSKISPTFYKAKNGKCGRFTSYWQKLIELPSELNEHTKLDEIKEIIPLEFYISGDKVDYSRIEEIVNSLNPHEQNGTLCQKCVNNLCQKCLKEYKNK